MLSRRQLQGFVMRRVALTIHHLFPGWGTDSNLSAAVGNVLVKHHTHSGDNQQNQQCPGQEKHRPAEGKKFIHQYAAPFDRDIHEHPIMN
jgi:hypothetical protein